MTPTLGESECAEQAAASISKQLFIRFDENQNGEIDFGEFVMALSVLSENVRDSHTFQAVDTDWRG